MQPSNAQSSFSLRPSTSESESAIYLDLLEYLDHADSVEDLSASDSDQDSTTSGSVCSSLSSSTSVLARVDARPSESQSLESSLESSESDRLSMNITSAATSVTKPPVLIAPSAFVTVSSTGMDDFGESGAATPLPSSAPRAYDPAFSRQLKEAMQRLADSQQDCKQECLDAREALKQEFLRAHAKQESVFKEQLVESQRSQADLVAELKTERIEGQRKQEEREAEVKRDRLEVERKQEEREAEVRRDRQEFLEVQRMDREKAANQFTLTQAMAANVQAITNQLHDMEQIQKTERQAHLLLVDSYAILAASHTSITGDVATLSARYDAVTTALTTVNGELDSLRTSSATKSASRDAQLATVQEDQRIISKALADLQTWALSKDAKALTSIRSRALLDNIMRALSLICHFTGLDAELSNGSRAFRRRLDEGLAKSAALPANPTAEQIQLDTERRRAILEVLLNKEAGTIAGVHRAEGLRTSLQKGLISILDSKEAMEALSARNHPIRLVGNYSAHVVQSLARLQAQLTEDKNHPLDSEAKEAMRIFSQFFLDLPETIPPPLFEDPSEQTAGPLSSSRANATK